MSANVKYAKDLSGNNYHGTYVDVTTGPGTGVTGSARRATFNGTQSRMFTGFDANTDLTNSNSFMFMMVFNRSTFTSRDDDLIAERLLTQYGTYKERIAVGINENKICVLYQKTDETLVVVPGMLDVVAGEDHHLLVRVSSTENRITVMLNGKITHDMVVPSLAAPGKVNSYIGGDGNRRLFHGTIDQPAFLQAHDLDKMLEYFHLIAFDDPFNYINWAGFDPNNSSASCLISQDKRTVTVASPSYRLSKLQAPISALSSVEFEMSLVLSDTTVVGACVVNSAEDEDLAVGDKFQSIGIDTDGVIKYRDEFGSQTSFETGRIIASGDFIRFTYQVSPHRFEIYLNDVLLHTQPVVAGVVWYPAASLRADSVRVNAGWRNFRHPTPLAGIPYVSFTEAESACLYNRVMPALDSVTALRATMLFIEAAGSLTMKDAFTEADIGVYSAEVDRLRPSITPSAADRSVFLDGGTVKMSAGPITGKNKVISAHLAFRLEYEDLFEDKILFYMDKGASWWKFFIRAGELCFEDSSDGGTPELITTGFIFPIQETCTAGFTFLNENGTSQDIYFYAGGVLAATDLTASVTISAAQGNGLYIGSKPNASEALTQFFSHAMYMAADTDNAGYREWKFRKLNQKIGGVGLVDFATYEFPLEIITERLYEFVTVTLPSMGGWSA